MTDNRKSVLSRCLGPIPIAMVFLALAVLTFRKGPDLLVDFGRELYVPWQLSLGKVLYLDVAHLFGPLSAYINSFLFFIFGASYTTLWVADLIVTLSMAFIIYLTFKYAADKKIATAAGLVFLCLFGFSQFLLTGNYCFASPYSHEATYGTLLSALCIFAFSKAARKNSILWTALAGCLTGAVALTKVEVFFAIAVTAIFYFALIGGIEKKRRVKNLLAFLAAFFFVLVASMGPLFLELNKELLAAASIKLLSSYLISFTRVGLADNLFYSELSGTKDLGANLFSMAKGVIAVIAVVLSGAALCSCPPDWRKKRVWTWGLGLLVACIAFFTDWLEMGYPLPVLTIAILVIWCIEFFRSAKQDREKAKKMLTLVLWAIFSLTLLAKVFFHARLYHYGFFLVLPATLALVVFLTKTMPDWLDRRYQSGGRFRIFIALVITCGTLSLLIVSFGFYRHKTYPIGTSGDRIYSFDPSVSARGVAVSDFLGWVDKNMKTDATFIALPEGVMLNYLTRRANPSRFTNFMPPELAVFQEDSMLDDFAIHPPDYFVVVHKETAEYGVGYFGDDPRFGKKIMEWVSLNYEPVATFGAEPLKDGRFGIRVLARSLKNPQILKNSK